MKLCHSDLIPSSHSFTLGINDPERCSAVEDHIGGVEIWPASVLQLDPSEDED